MGVVALAAVILVTLLLPINVWKRAEFDATYAGFDPPLVYVRGVEPRSTNGGVYVSHDALRLIGIPGSNPAAHLVASPMDFEVSMEVRVLRAEAGTVPLTVAVSNWREAIGYRLKFGPPPEFRIIGQLVQSGKTLREIILGSYNLAEIYKVTVSLDRRNRRFRVAVQGFEQPPSGSRWTVLRGGPGNPSYRELRSERIRVEPGRRYAIGGFVKLASGDGWYKLVLVWFDRNGNALSSLNDWRSPDELSGWTKVRFVGVAPQRAAYARMYLGAGGSSVFYMTDLFVIQNGEYQGNLLSNGSFVMGPQGWEVIGPGAGPDERPTVAAPRESAVEDTVLGEVAPTLFIRTHDVALTLAADAESGVTISEVARYMIRVPKQSWTGARVEDWRARGLVAALAVLTLLVLLLRGAVVVDPRSPLISTSGQVNGCFPRIQASSASRCRLTAWTATAVFLATVVNVVLFRFGYHVYDFVSAKIWAYVGGYHGPAEIYRLPALTAAASDSWNGVPWGTSTFPYGAVMAYFFTGIGWLYRLLLSEQSNFTYVTDLPGSVIKTAILGFFLSDVVLIYLILRSVGLARRSSLVTSGLLLYNPAAWFVGSVWGETHVVSIFFLLLSVLWALQGNVTGAWAALALTALTRPQLLVPVVFVALVYLWSWPPRRNLIAIAMAILFSFTLMLPFLFGLSPAFPIIVWRQTIGFANISDPQVGKFLPISHGTLNLWPLVTPFAEGVRGPDRYFIPSVTSLLGPFTYNDVSNWLLVVALIALGVVVTRYRREVGKDGRWIAHVAVLSLLALLALKARISNHHYILALPLLMLVRVTVRPFTFYLSVAGLTLTTLVSTWGAYSLAVPGLDLGRLVPYLDPRYSRLSFAFASLMTSDVFITVGSLINLSIFVCLAWELWSGLMAQRRTGIATEEIVHG